MIPEKESMTRLQRAQLRQSEIRSQINSELDKEERDNEVLERLTREAQEVEIELRAALVVEQEEAIPDRIDIQEGWELSELFRRTSLTDYVDETLPRSMPRRARLTLWKAFCWILRVEIASRLMRLKLQGRSCWTWARTQP